MFFFFFFWLIRISKLFSIAEHINCVKCIDTNFKSKPFHEGKLLRDILWKAIRVIYVKEFENTMSETKSHSKDLYK